MSSGRVFVTGTVNGELDYETSSRILGSESVTVPAGPFTALKVQTTFDYTGPGGSVSQVQTNWTVPLLGIVKLVDNVDGAIETYELVSARIDSDADGVEVGTDNCPLVANTDQIDTDLDDDGNACDSGDDDDGLSDDQEIGRGTDPLNADTDGDGMDDGEEVLAGRNPLVDESIVIHILNSILNDEQ